MAHSLSKHRPEAMVSAQAQRAVDDAVVQYLPPNATILSARPFHISGLGAGTSATRITFVLPDPDGSTSTHSYFLKTALGSFGYEMLRGEFHGVRHLYRHVPRLVPRPVAWGTYAAQPSADPERGTHFYLCEYTDMVNTWEESFARHFWQTLEGDGRHRRRPQVVRGGAELAGMQNTRISGGGGGGGSSSEGASSRTGYEEGPHLMHHNHHHQQQRHPRDRHHRHYGGHNENGHAGRNLRRPFDSAESISDGTSDAGTEEGGWTDDPGAAPPAAWGYRLSR